MNSKRKLVHVLQCTECPNTFISIGHTIIGMAQPRRIHQRFDEITGQMVDMTGVCPAHKKKLGIPE